MSNFYAALGIFDYLLIGGLSILLYEIVLLLRKINQSLSSER